MHFMESLAIICRLINLIVCSMQPNACLKARRAKPSLLLKRVDPSIRLHNRGPECGRRQHVLEKLLHMVSDRALFGSGGPASSFMQVESWGIEGQQTIIREGTSPHRTISVYYIGCWDCVEDRHGLPGDGAVVARSWTNLLSSTKHPRLPLLGKSRISIARRCPYLLEDHLAHRVC